MAKLMRIDEFACTSRLNESSNYHNENYSSALNEFLNEKFRETENAKIEFKKKYPYLYDDMEKFVDLLMKEDMKCRKDLYDEATDRRGYEIFKNHGYESEKKIDSYGFGAFELLENEGEWKYSDDYIIVDSDSSKIMSFRKEHHLLNINEFVEWFIYCYCEPLKDFENALETLKYRYYNPYSERKRYCTEFYSEEMFDIVHNMYVKWCEANGFEMMNEAKYNVTYSCGHTGTIELLGKYSDRERKLEWMEQCDCPDCRNKKANDHSEQRRVERGLTELEGTPKQVAWANTIRENAYKSLDIIRDKFATTEQAKSLVDEWEVKMNEMTAAKWWIDNRYGIPSITDENGAKQAVYMFKTLFL